MRRSEVDKCLGWVTELVERRKSRGGNLGIQMLFFALFMMLFSG